MVVLENYTVISCTNNNDILSFISVMLLSATGQLWRDKNYAIFLHEST
jgi:hypothetical protein